MFRLNPSMFQVITRKDSVDASIDIDLSRPTSLN